MREIASITASNVTTQDLDLLDGWLNALSDVQAEDRREGDLIEFLTHLSETLRQGENVVLYAVEPSHRDLRLGPPGTQKGYHLRG